MRKTKTSSDLALSDPAVGLERGTRLIPATDWSQFHAWPPIGGLRHLIFNAHKNGFEAVIRRVGRRVLLDEQAYFQWVAQQAVTK